MFGLVDRKTGKRSKIVFSKIEHAIRYRRALVVSFPDGEWVVIKIGG